MTTDDTQNIVLVLERQQTSPTRRGTAFGCRSCRTTRPAGCRRPRSATSTRCTRICTSTARTSRATLKRDGKPVFKTIVGVGPLDLADAARRVLHPRQAHELQRPVLRPDRVRNERALGRADGLAGRRLRRRPRDERAGDPAGARLARLHPDAERRDPQARQAHAGRHAADDHLAARAAVRGSSRRSCSGSARSARPGSRRSSNRERSFSVCQTPPFACASLTFVKR